MFKDKPIDDRGVPERLFDIAAEVDQVAPLAGLGALDEEVRGGDCREGDPGRERQALATHAPGEAVHLSKISDWKRRFWSIDVDAQSAEKLHFEAKTVQERRNPCDKEIFQESSKALKEIKKAE